jgi:hypothetical protein
MRQPFLDRPAGRSTGTLSENRDWRHPLWLALLVSASVVFSLGLACAAPFTAFGAAAALTLSRRDALVLVMSVWLANQPVGFTLLHYPWTANAFAWGVALGVVAVLATLASQWVAKRSADAARVLSFSDFRDQCCCFRRPISAQPPRNNRRARCQYGGHTFRGSTVRLGGSAATDRSLPPLRGRHTSRACHRATSVGAYRRLILVSVDRVTSHSPHTRAKSRGFRPRRATPAERRTVCWREPDSNHRSRSCERSRLLPKGDARPISRH